MATLTISLKKIILGVKFAERTSASVQNNNVSKKNSAFCSVLQDNPAVASPKEQLYEQMTSNPASTERNIQKPNASLLDCRPEQKSLVTYHTLRSLYVCVWLVNTLTSTAPTVITSWYLRTMGKEFLFRFRRRPWGRNAWRTPKNVCVGR